MNDKGTSMVAIGMAQLGVGLVSSLFGFRVMSMLANLQEPMRTAVFVGGLMMVAMAFAYVVYLYQASRSPKKAGRRKPQKMPMNTLYKVAGIGAIGLGLALLTSQINRYFLPPNVVLPPATIIEVGTGTINIGGGGEAMLFAPVIVFIIILAIAGSMRD